MASEVAHSYFSIFSNVSLYFTTLPVTSCLNKGFEVVCCSHCPRIVKTLEAIHIAKCIFTIIMIKCFKSLVFTKTLRLLQEEALKKPIPFDSILRTFSLVSQ